MKRFLLPLIAAMVAAPTLAQQKLVESIEVRVVNVDVVVTDRSGNPVTGLTKDDFQLFENGRPQTITNLYEVRPEAISAQTPAAAVGQAAPPPPAEMRMRRFVIFVDNYSLHPFKRNAVLKALDRFVDEQMRPNDEAEIVLWTQSLRVITPFTTEKKELKAGVARLSELSRSGMSIEDEAEQVKRQCQDLLEAARDSRMLSMAQAFSQCKASVSAHADRVWSINKTLLEAMRLTMTTLSGLEGKKVMIFAGAHMPENPGLELYMYMSQLFQPYLKQGSGSDMQGFATDRTQTFSIEKLARQANADGVTMYMIDAADSRDKTSAEKSERTAPDEAFLEFTNTAMAFSTLADVTGGVAMSNTSNFNAAFATVGRDLNSYYSLGYKPADDKPGDRRIVVKSRNAAYQVRSRMTYAPKTSEEQIKDRVVANIYHAGMTSDWPIELHTGKPEPNGERFSVPVELSLPSTVTLLPQGEELVGGFTVYIAVGTDSGGMSKVTKSEQPIRIPKSAEAELRRKPMTFNATIVVRPGDSTLSIAAVDQISNATGLARTRIAAR